MTKELLEKLTTQHHATLLSQNEYGFQCKCRYNHEFFVPNGNMYEWCLICDSKEFKQKLINETNLELNELNIQLRVYDMSKYGMMSVICPKNHIKLFDADEIANKCDRCDPEQSTVVHDSQMWNTNFNDISHEQIISKDSDSDVYSINTDFEYMEESPEDTNSQDESDGFDFDRLDSNRFDSNRFDSNRFDSDMFDSDRFDSNPYSNNTAMRNYDRFNRFNYNNTAMHASDPPESEFDKTICNSITDEEFSKLVGIKPTYRENNVSTVNEFIRPINTSIHAQIMAMNNTSVQKTTFNIRRLNGDVYTSIYCNLDNLEACIATAVKNHNACFKENTMMSDLYIDNIFNSLEQKSDELNELRVSDIDDTMLDIESI
jgi:hypothetical protein